MRIAIIQGAFLPVPPIQGGAVEKLWLTMGAELVKHGCTVTHISKIYQDTPLFETINGVSHKRVKGFTRKSKMLINIVLDLIYSFHAVLECPKSDIIITNTFWAPILLRFIRRGHIYVSFERFPKGQTFLYSHVSRIRVPSSAVQTAIEEQTPLAKSIVSVIPNFLPEKFSAVVADTTSKRTMRLLYVGRLHPEKGIHLLISAALLLEVPLDIIGSHDIDKGGGGDEYLSKLLSMANNTIKFHGPIHDDDILVSLYKNAFAFVYPSLAKTGETFGLAPLEAMACGTIPIVSSLECFRDFIEDSVHGFYFDHTQGNKVLQLETTLGKLLSLDNHQLNQMRKSCIEQSSKYKANIIAKLFIHDFERIIEGK